MSVPAAPAVAEWSISLPAFPACDPATPPELPDRWRAVAVMQPFLEGQIDVGEFVYDATVPAMRASVYGLETGAVDLLVTEAGSYRLSGPHRAPTQCTALGRMWQVPPARWLSEDAVCIGKTRLAGRIVNWWKMPAHGDRANMHWYDATTNLPWRSMFVRPSREPAILSDYSMSHFPTFEPLKETRLSELRDFCHAQAGTAGAGDGTPPVAVRGLMRTGDAAAEDERRQRIGALVPGVSHGACSRMSAVRWPEQFVSTLVLTPIKFAQPPYSTVLYYDWTQAKTQLALMFAGAKPDFVALVSLKDRIGYRFRRLGPNAAICDADLPGLLRPDWMSVAGCQCRAVIERTSAFGLDADSQILSCPIKDQRPRIMWNWYTSAGRPLVFFEAAPKSGGFLLADYRDWLPGKTGKPEDFKLPPICEAKDPSYWWRSGGASRPDYWGCSDCHTTEN